MGKIWRTNTKKKWVRKIWRIGWRNRADPKLTRSGIVFGIKFGSAEIAVNSAPFQPPGGFNLWPKIVDDGIINSELLRFLAATDRMMGESLNNLRSHS